MRLAALLVLTGCAFAPGPSFDAEPEDAGVDVRHYALPEPTAATLDAATSWDAWSGHIDWPCTLPTCVWGAPQKVRPQ